VKVSAAASIPWMRSAVIKQMKTCLETLQKDKGIDSPVVLELGSGWGALAIAAAKACPHAKIIGYEISPAPLWIARLRAFLGRHKNLSFVGGNFYDSDFRHADCVLTYLTVNLMSELRPNWNRN
jgi:methylase of polypeptide subunit release factors